MPMDDQKREDDRDFEELRRLLLGDELEELEELRERLGDRERFSREVVGVLPRAVTDSSQQGEALSQAMVPTVEEIVRLSIKKDINKFADALFPVIGPAIRRAIKETIRQMLQSLNQTLEQSLSWQGLKWRIESIRTGIPFAQIALLHGLVYRVEQVFLIHRETGLLLCHLSQDDSQQQNPDLVSSMLSAINDFVGDSFAVEDDRALNSIEVGELSIWIEPGPGAILALAIRGEAPNGLRTSMHQILEEVQAELGDALAGFNGDTGIFEERVDLLEECMQAQYRPKKKGLSAKTIFVVLLLLSLLAFWIGYLLQQSHQRQAYVDLLQQESGYVVTEAERQDGVLVINGLRDPLARMPDEILAQSKLSAEQVEHRFAPYQSLAPEFVESRARRLLAPPADVALSLRDGSLVVSGVSDLAWYERLQVQLPLIAGIEGLDDSTLRIRFTPAITRPPAGVTLEFDEGVLYVEGAAEQDWIDSLSELSQQYPEVDRVDLRALVNLTEAALVRHIAALEKEVVFFDVATAFDFDSIDTPRITGLAKDIIAAANKLSRNVLIVVRGYSDSVGSFEDNVFLSEERADYVAQVLFNAGISPRYVSIRGLEQAVAAETSEAERRYNRRVGFEVIVE